MKNFYLNESINLLIFASYNTISIIVMLGVSGGRHSGGEQLKELTFHRNSHGEAESRE